MIKIVRGVRNGLKRYSLYAFKRSGILRFSNSGLEGNKRAILVNSIPKSGTHLLSNIIKVIPGYKFYGEFFASTPSFRMREIPKDYMLRNLERIVPSEITHGHLFYESEYSELLEKYNVLHIFIFRDPRDILCSEVDYLSGMAPWHAMHKYYKQLGSFDEMLKFAIMGNDFIPTGTAYDCVGDRLGRYVNWLDDESCFKVRYEDISGDRKAAVFESIMRHVIRNTPNASKLPDLVKDSLRISDPEHSHTFNKGTKGRWEKLFNAENRDLFEKYSKGILQKLGYE